MQKKGNDSLSFSMYLGLDKHFLDTSVARHIILGSTPYRKYFEDYFGGDKLYVSKYVKMEFFRSFMCPVFDFYFTLDLPNIQTIDDALAVYSNNFKSSELKALIQFVGQIFRTRGFCFSSPLDKEKAVRSVGQVAVRQYYLFRNRFRDIGVNAARCQRADMVFKVPRDSNKREAFQRFFLHLRTLRIVKKNAKSRTSYISVTVPQLKNALNMQKA